MVPDELIRLGDALYDLSVACHSFADNEKCRRDPSAGEELGELKGSWTRGSRLLGLGWSIIERRTYGLIRRIVPMYFPTSEHRQRFLQRIVAVASASLQAQLTYKSRKYVCP
jgi:hypothetical protein